MNYVGVPMKRLEDRRLVVGAGCYLDDVVRPGMLHLAIVRSAHAHARLRAIDVRRAAAHPGVAACLTAADVAVDAPGGAPVIPIRMGGKPQHTAYLQPTLARDRVRYVGEPVALVVATDRLSATDARELVEIDYEVLAAVVDPGRVASEASPRLFADGNVADSWTSTFGDVDGAVRAASCVVRERFTVGRQTGAPRETRGLAAEWDAATRRLSVWGPTKVPYFNRRTLAGMLSLAEAQIDYLESDVGGGFGSRGEFYPEEFLVPYLARRLGRPVKWVEDRHEHFLAINHSREQQWSVTLAADGDGRLLALDATLVNDQGAYLRTHGVWVGALTAAYLAGPYRIPGFRCAVSCVLTNKTPTGTVRAPGFFESSFVRERMLDAMAARLGLDPAEIRRRNLVRPQDAPYTVATVGRAITGREADFAGEDFGAMFEQALKAGDYEARVAACRERNAGGGDVKYGVGRAAIVETSGAGPTESAKVTLTSEGTIVLASGGTSVGQGLGTTMAQVCADVLQVPPGEIEVHLGDSRFLSHGVGSYASRSAVMAGSAVHHASTRLRETIVALAARSFEASPDDIILDGGEAFVRGLPDRRCSLRAIAALADGPLEQEWRHETQRGLGSMAVHMAMVAVDIHTGHVRTEAYFVLCDVGRAINPAIVEGQLVGGVIQGLGHATMEEIEYDESGQLLTGTFMDYAIPTANDVPPVHVVTHNTAAASNPLGVKGAGEGGTSGVGAALANAVAAALGEAAAPRHLPLTARRVKAALDGRPVESS